MSFLFTDRLRRDLIVRDVRNRYPQTDEVFERFGVRPSCWDCSLAVVAHRSGVSLEELLGALEEAISQRVPSDQKEWDES